MNGDRLRTLLRDYTTVLVLALVCLVLSVLTWTVQYPTGAKGGRLLAERIRREVPPGAVVMLAIRDTAEDVEFGRAVQSELSTTAHQLHNAWIKGQPAEARRTIDVFNQSGGHIDVIAATDVTADWQVFKELDKHGPAVRGTRVLTPPGYGYPDFLKLTNLLNIVNSNVYIAVIAIGLTMVIVAGGIDLSVGSLVALSSVVAARLIRDAAGGSAAGPLALGLCCLAAIGVATLAGTANGLFVTLLRIKPFIATLAMMLIASGLAFVVSKENTIYGLPRPLQWLTRGKPFGLPNSVALMLLLYALAHVVMSRTIFGRHLYAVGGNRQAAWLCGVPVRRVELAAYAISGALAGLAGVLMAADYLSGVPTFGETYELQVIAAVVVGGTSLSGGRGKMFGTLLGALLIAVVNNGMNLMGISSNPQKIVLGLVILAAAAFDRLTQRTRED